MASVLETHGFLGAAAYVAAKHVVVGLTKTVALDYAERDVRVNAVGPAFVDPARGRQAGRGAAASAGPAGAA